MVPALIVTVVGLGFFCSGLFSLSDFIIIMSSSMILSLNHEGR